MGKPVAGEVVVLPFPQTDLQAGKRRPVVADLPGDDLILCQITSQFRRDAFSISLAAQDFISGQLAVDSFARVNRLFTVDHAVIIYSVGRITAPKLAEVCAAIRQVFS